MKLFPSKDDSEEHDRSEEKAPSFRERKRARREEPQDPSRLLPLLFLLLFVFISYLSWTAFVQ